MIDRLLAIVLIITPISAALAVAVDESRLDDPAMEAKARDIMKEIRCLVCQNQSIEDSNADLAKDLRQIVRERVAAGDNPAQVKTYLVARYGDWILLRPPVNERTIILWIAPLALLVAGITLAFLYFRNRPPARPEPLNAEEVRRLSEMMNDRDGQS